MKIIMSAALLALAFTTGFTCSKKPADVPPAQEQMGAPADATVAPADPNAAPADPNAAPADPNAAAPTDTTAAPHQ